MAPKTKSVILYYLFFILPALFIFIYGKYRCDHKEFKDPLETQIILGLDGWSVSHATLFMFIGYFYPQSFLMSMSIGALWEGFEHLSGKNRPGWLGGYGGCNNLATDKETGNWWYGKWTDLLCNAGGFFMGMGLRSGPTPPIGGKT
jgi:hypothetical protein